MCVQYTCWRRASPCVQALADYKLAKQREMMEAEDSLARRRDDDNRRKALEDERVKAAIRQRAGASPPPRKVHESTHPRTHRLTVWSNGTK